MRTIMLKYRHEFAPVQPEANLRECLHCGTQAQVGRSVEIAESRFCPAHQHRHDAFVAAALGGLAAMDYSYEGAGARAVAYADKAMAALAR